MCDFLRGSALTEPKATRFRHRRDIQATWDAIPLAERPLDTLLVIGDNGSGYDPCDEENKYYAYKFAKKNGIAVIGLASYAAGESAKNIEVERPWALHKKCLVGLRLGCKQIRSEEKL